MKQSDRTPVVEPVLSSTAQPMWRRILLFPLTRLVIALFVLWLGYVLHLVAIGFLPLPQDAVVARNFVLVLALFGAYVAYVRLIERRPVRELHARYAPREFAAGLAIGGGMIVVVVGTLWALGYYRVMSVGPLSILAVSLATTGATAFWEEVIFRGVLFRIVEEGLGTWLALIVSAAAFGLLHLGNENVSILAVLTTAGVAGVFLGGVYVLTRRLWLAIGAHFAVNLAQGPIFGLPVSGRERTGVLQGTLEGPELLTGGSYGIEASLVMTVLGSAVAIYVVRRAHVQDRFVRPLWSGRRSSANGGILSELT